MASACTDPISRGKEFKRQSVARSRSQPEEARGDALQGGAPPAQPRRLLQGDTPGGGWLEACSCREGPSDGRPRAGQAGVSGSKRPRRSSASADSSHLAAFSGTRRFRQSGLTRADSYARGDQAGPPQCRPHRSAARNRHTPNPFPVHVPHHVQSSALHVQTRGPSRRQSRTGGREHPDALATSSSCGPGYV